MLIQFAPVILLIASACANTEKTIFLGPPTANIPSAHPTLEDLHVDILTPTNWEIRIHLEAQFPNISSPNGKATWLILDELTEGQRYEVRVCWAAIVSYSSSNDIIYIHGSIEVKRANQFVATYPIQNQHL